MPKLLERDWMAKAWTGEVAGVDGPTPDVLFLDGPRWPAPDFAVRRLASPLASNELVYDGSSTFPPYPLSVEPLAPRKIAFGEPSTRGEGEQGPKKPFRRDGATDAAIILHGPPDGWPQIMNSPERSWLPLAVLANAVQLYQEPRELAARLCAFKASVGARGLLYAPAVATPANLAVLAYAGVDLFDDVQCITAARRGQEMFHGGIFDSHSTFESLLDANRRALWSELHHVRRHLSAGRLREFAEHKSTGDTRAVELLRHLDLRHFDSVERFVPVAGPSFQANSKAGLRRPDVQRWRLRLSHRYRKPSCADILLLLPCSARKPYSDSKTHRMFAEAIGASGVAARVHEVIVTSPLGLVPRELECTYPAKEYDVPVTGDWDADEGAMLSNALKDFISRNEYSATVAHLGDEILRATDAAPAAASTGGRPTSSGSLAKLSGLLAKAAKELQDGPSWGERRRADLEALASFQFGEAGRHLLDGCDVRERQLHLVASRGKTQVASLSRGRGLLSLTLEGGSILAETGEYCVEIDDFVPRGNVFAVGVASADPQIRVGDDVAVVHAGSVRAVGVAQMPGQDMALAPEGEAVRVRHKIDG